MFVDPVNLGKADSRLRDALTAAQGPEELRVLLTLRAKEELFAPPPSPADFATREEYRRALIERRERQLKHEIGETVRSLVALGIRVSGETLMRTVVADGTARQIAGALAIPGVESASLDRPLDLIQLVAHPAPVGPKKS